MRDAAGRRLDRGDPAAVRRVAQRAADVVAEPERRHAGRQRAPPRRRWTRPRSRPGPTGCGSGRAARSPCGCAGRGRGGSCGAIGIAPAARRRSTSGASIGATASASAGTPDVVGVPATSMFSLTVNGTPCSGPRVGRRVGRVGRRARLVGQHEHDRVEVAVDGLDALQVRVDDLARGHLARARSARPAHRRRGATAPRTSPSPPPTREWLPRRAGVPTGMATTPESFSDLRRVALALPAVASAAPGDPHRLGRLAGRARATINAFQADVGAAVARSTGTACPRPRRSRTASRAASSQPARRRVRHARHRHRDLRRLAVGRRVQDATRATSCSRRSARTHRTCASTCPARRARRSRARSASCSPTSTRPRARAVTFLDSRGATILEVAGPARPERALSSSACASATASASPRSRSAPVRVRSRPASSTAPQADLAAIDDVIFAEPQADLAPPPESEFVPVDVRRRAPTTQAAAPRLRASLLPLAKSVRRAHAEGRARQLGRHRGHAHARQGQRRPSRSRRARPRSPSRSRRTPSAASRSSSLTAGRASRRA